MDEMRKDIFDSIDDRDDLEYKSVAKALGVTPRYFTQFKSGERNLSFRLLLKLSFMISKKNPHEKIINWCKSFTTTGCIKHSFEYATITRNVELLENLLLLHSNSTGVIKECVIIYSFILKYMKNQINTSEMAVELQALKNIKDETLHTLVSIYNCIAKFHKRNFADIPAIASDLEVKIKEMSDKNELFLKECYLHRLSEVLAHTHLHFNNLEAARHYSWILINAGINSKVKSDAFFVLGMSYLNEDSEKCISYLNESLIIMKETGVDFLIEFAKYNIDYAKMILEIDLPEDADEAIVACAEFKKGNVTCESVKEVILNSGDADLISYFSGISGEGNESLYGKFLEYVAEANMYYASILVKELSKIGENSGFVKSLMNIKLNNKGDGLFEKTFISSFNSGSNFNGSICA